MATSPISEFGFAPGLVRAAEVELGSDLEQLSRENLNRYSIARSQLEEPFRTSPSSGAAEQRAATTPLPLQVSIVKSQIESLPSSEDVEVRPTGYAFNEAKRAVVGAYAALPRVGKVPAPVIGTDDVGGILISWASGNKYVAAKFASEPGLISFLYFEEGAEHRALELEQRSLADRLRWLSTR